MKTQPNSTIDHLGFFNVITLETVLEYQAYDTFTVAQGIVYVWM